MKKKICVLISILLIAFIAVCIFVLTGSAQRFNGFVYSRVAMMASPAVTSMMKIVSNVGDWLVYVPIAILLLSIPKTRYRAGIPAAFVLAASATGNIILKQIFHVARPDVHRLISVTGYGFPSGHAMNGTAFIGIIAYLLSGYFDKKELKAAITASFVIFMLLMGVDRVYLGVHSATDVIAGYLCGLIIMLSAVLIINASPETTPDCSYI